MDDNNEPWRPRLPIPNGSIVRTTWLDEEFEQYSDYDRHNDDGYESPGVLAFGTKELGHFLRMEHTGAKPCHVPHNTKGLLVIGYTAPNQVPMGNLDARFVWYHVLWGEKDVWIHAKHIILLKASTQQITTKKT